MTPRFLACALLWATGSVLAQDQGLRQCRSVADALARLACYDALPLSPATASAPAQAAAAARPAASMAATAAATQPAPGPSAAVVPTATAASAFGLEPARDEAEKVSSRIPGRFEGWGPRSQFTLSNGQVWRVSDDSSAVYDLVDPQVTVRRAALGSYMMDIEGTRRSPRVRRVQ